jgi:hypothetical protein
MLVISGMLALVLLVLFWFNREFSIRAKLLVTVVYLATFAGDLIVPFCGSIMQLVFALGLYFLMYPSNWGQK